MTHFMCRYAVAVFLVVPSALHAFSNVLWQEEQRGHSSWATQQHVTGGCAGCPWRLIAGWRASAPPNPSLTAGGWEPAHNQQAQGAAAGI